MPKVHFPRSGGNQWMDTFYHLDAGQQATTGDTYFVGSGVTGATDSAGYGRSPESPFATIGYAVATAAAANQGDTVYVLPGHTETITAAAGVAMSKAGVRVIGVGWGRTRPRVNYTTSANASFDITAANCSVENLFFTGMGVAAVTNMVNVKTAAADCTIRNCEFEHGNATNQAANVILTDATANRLWIDSCFFHGSTDAGTNSAISLVGGNEIRITNNVILGNYHATAGVIVGATTDSLNLAVAGNVIVNRTASSTKVIVLTATSTGAIVNNRFGILSGVAPVTAAAIDITAGNYYRAAAGVGAGTLI